MKSYVIKIGVTVSDANAEKILKNPRVYTEAVFRVVARRIKDEGFAVGEARIIARAISGD